MELGLFFLMGMILRASLTQRESVCWHTPTSSDNAVAVIRSGPRMRSTIRFLNPFVYLAKSHLHRPRKERMQFRYLGPVFRPPRGAAPPDGGEDRPGLTPWPDPEALRTGSIFSQVQAATILTLGGDVVKTVGKKVKR